MGQCENCGRVVGETAAYKWNEDVTLNVCSRCRSKMAREKEWSKTQVAVSRLREAGKYAEALKLLRDSATPYPSSRAKREALMLEAILLGDLRATDQEAETYKRLVSLGGGSPYSRMMARLGLAGALRTSGAADHAAQVLRQALLIGLNHKEDGALLSILREYCSLVNSLQPPSRSPSKSFWKALAKTMAFWSEEAPVPQGGSWQTFCGSVELIFAKAKEQNMMPRPQA